MKATPENLKELDFFRYIKANGIHLFQLVGTSFVCELYEVPSGEGYFSCWWESLGKGDEEMVTFQRVFDSLSSELKKKFIDHLDLFS